MSAVDEIRDGCAWVAAQATHVRVVEEAIPAYAASLPAAEELPGLDPDVYPLDGSVEERAAFFLTLDAINFGSGWFPTLRKREGRSGYFTIALALRDRFRAHGAWSAAELRTLDAREIAAVLGQDPRHELMGLFARSLTDLGARVGDDFRAPIERAGGSAVAFAEELARWDCFADVSTYADRRVPFYKRAQIAAADLHLAGVADFADLERLTLFADNLVPHVLRLDGILRFEPELVARIEAGELLEHDSAEEVEMRAGAVHAAELICRARPDLTPQQVDQLLWTRGGGARYKAVPRPRARCTAY
ncbi:MAG TPA: queuosine salvage family protein [Conexibacter sp.]|nr:queuosine salvage family protein [Conexibacter sp.]